MIMYMSEWLLNASAIGSHKDMSDLLVDNDVDKLWITFFISV